MCSVESVWFKFAGLNEEEFVQALLDSCLHRNLESIQASQRSFIESFDKGI